MLICKECEHYHSIYRGVGVSHVAGCGVDGKRDPVDGERVYRRCSLMRASDGACGPDGKLHSNYVAPEPAAPVPAPAPDLPIADMAGANELLRTAMIERLETDIRRFDFDVEQGLVTGTAAAMLERDLLVKEQNALRLGVMNWALWKAHTERQK